MRDIVLVSAIMIGVWATLRYPFVGVLLWAWLSIASPHQEAWGFSKSIPLNLIVAGVTIGAWFAQPNRRLPPPNFLYGAFIAFLIWVTLASFFATYPGWSWQFWDRCWKTIILGLFVAALADNKVRIHALVWVIVVSLFHYGVKGGLFTLVTGGQFHVVGPSGTYITDNNSLALALLLGLPLANYLRMQTEAKWLSTGILIAMGLTVVAIFGSQSRGAFLGLAALLFAGVLRVRHRFLYIAIALALIYPVLQFMPEQYHERIASIASATDDGSFMGRVVAWKVAFYCAIDHFPFGAGFYTPQLPSVYNAYFPTEHPHAAHSIYFQVLGEHGFIGFGIYLSLIIGSFIQAARIRKLSRHHVELNWAYDLASMIQLSLIAFCVGGAALSMAYYDVFIISAALLMPMSELVRKHLANETQAKQTAPPINAAIGVQA